VVAVHDGGAPVMTFAVPTAGATEVALILAELYLRNGQWKLRAVGQGFKGGLKPLAESFGVKILDEPSQPPPAPRPPAPTRPSPSVVPPVPPAPPAAPVSLQKITLSKSRATIDLSKRGGGYGEVKVNLNWNKGSAGKSAGFFGLGKPKTVDLDLGCLYELKEGQIGAVQALGNAFGDFSRAPFVMLQGDDRSGSVVDGEWMRINGAHWDKIRRIIVFAFIYEGAPNWAQTDATVTLYSPDQGPIEVPLDEGRNDMGMCAVALIENVNGQMRITRECRYFQGHRQLDSHYGWGLRWSAGSKD
jgi:tellurite resistance protein TerA